MIGIYKFTNKINGHSYIGQSIHILLRKKDHLYNAFHSHPGNQLYNKAFYRALRKYGILNFDFLVLLECDLSALNLREIYWIDFYNTYKDGYNETPGGEGVKNQFGLKHPNHKLTLLLVYQIRLCYKNHEIKLDVEELFKSKINHSGFSKIWNGSTWKRVHMDVYTTLNRNFHRLVANSHPGKSNGKGNQITKLQIIDIRTRIKSLPQDNVWKDYKIFFVLKQTFNNICLYKTYKYLTV